MNEWQRVVLHLQLTDIDALEQLLHDHDAGEIELPPVVVSLIKHILMWKE